MELDIQQVFHSFSMDEEGVIEADIDDEEVDDEIGAFADDFDDLGDDDEDEVEEI
ncbi:MAG: hypothetical protein WDZ88_01785 [Candidatus Paceibacterota bacterium]